MLTKLTLTNFKNFSHDSFDLKKINILTGYNGRGKSTILQSLLLLSQSVMSKGNFEKLHLNGEWVNLGDFDEILNNPDSFITKIHLNTDIEPCSEVHFEYGISDDDKVAQLEEFTINGISLNSQIGKASSDDDEKNKKIKDFSSPPRHLINLFQDFHFISANRCGPVKYVDKLEIPDFHRVGKNGNLTINTIASYNDSVKNEMNIDKSDINQYPLHEAVSRWISYIMDGGDLEVKGNKKEEKSKVLSVNFTNPISNTYHRAENVGFGYSYILSIVVTSLVAKAGSTVLIENPEAHLHPKAQSKITHLLTRLAERGVQVMIETHSEHILNGFRLCALKDDYTLSNTDLSIYFFDKNYKTKPLRILENGRIEDWPNGFFDQQESDLAEIMRLGARKLQK